MGGVNSGRRPSADTIVNRSYSTPILTGRKEPIIIPNLSGDHSKGHTGTPQLSGSIANKEYVDTAIAAIPGAVDWTADQSPLVINAANYVDNNTTDHTALSNIGTRTHAQLEITDLGLSGSITSNTSNILGISGSVTSNTGNISSNTGNISTNTANILDLSGGYNTHIADASDPHSITLTQTNEAVTNLSGSNMFVTSDFILSGSARVLNMVLGTNETPPTASNFVQGSIYVQYTA